MTRLIFNDHDITEPLIAEALSEIREMFPGVDARIIKTSSWHTGGIEQEEWDLQIGQFYLSNLLDKSRTLAALIAKARGYSYYRQSPKKGRRGSSKNRK